MMFERTTPMPVGEVSRASLTGNVNALAPTQK